MTFSSKAEYGVRLMVELGRQDGQGPTSLKAIADAEELPLSYLEHVVASLKKANLVESSRGAHGGYRLARPAEEIAMDEVVLALEGSIAPMDCFTDDPTGRVACSHEDDHGASCSTKLLWMRVHSGMVQALQQTTLAELVEFSRCSDPVQAAVAEGAVALPVVQG
jgi:Rrf2 family transcriptional regulator, cysteine metabolism repressor